jgi:hypothetical protein
MSRTALNDLYPGRDQQGPHQGLPGPVNGDRHVLPMVLQGIFFFFNLQETYLIGLNSWGQTFLWFVVHLRIFVYFLAKERDFHTVKSVDKCLYLFPTSGSSLKSTFPSQDFKK